MPTVKRPEDIIRVRPPISSLWDIARNRDVTTGVGKLIAQDLSITTDRLGVWRQWEMVAGWPVDHGTVADQAAMLALHTFAESATTQTLPRYVAPGDSCTRANDPGWRWHCMRGHGTALADWERRPLGGALEGLAVSGHTHAISDINLLQDELDGKQDELTISTAGAALLNVATPASEKIPQINPDGTISLVDMSGGSSGNTLVIEILADSPTAYWRCNEASGNVLDSSGNALDLTLSGAPIRSFSRLARGLSDEHVRWTDTYAARSGALGVATPWSGSWSCEFMLLLPSALDLDQGVLSVGGVSSEDESANYQLFAAITSSRQLTLIWEYDGGANVIHTPPTTLALGTRNHVIWTKDSVAKVVRCYLNGVCIFVSAYTQEPTGGSASTTEIGRNSTAGTSTAVLGHVAVYAGTVLSSARVQAHAQAAGVM